MLGSNHLPLKMQINQGLKSIPPVKGKTFIRDVCARLSLEVFSEMFGKNVERNTAVADHLSIQDVIKKDNIASIQFFFVPMH